MTFVRPHRLSRRQLTDAGRSFVPQAARILADVRNAVLIAQRAAASEVEARPGRLYRICFVQSSGHGRVPKLQGRLPRKWSCPLEESPSTVLANALREGRIDAAFVRPPLRTDEGIALHLIDEEEMVVAVPSSHPFAQRTGPSRSKDLAEETFVLYPRTERPGLADTVIAACEKAGFVPKVKQYTPQLSSTINLVAASLGISIVPRSMRGLQPQAVTYKSLRDQKLTALLGVAHIAQASRPPPYSDS